MQIREAVYLELFLQMYDNWRIGKYFSNRGLLDISEMKTPHLVNAIASLEKKREERYNLVMQLTQDGDIIDAIQDTYSKRQDIMSIKIRELKTELDERLKEKD